MRTIIMIILLMLPIKVIAPDMKVIVIQINNALSIPGELNWYNIDKELRNNNVQHIDKAKRQIRLETANLTSRFCRECNNLFGMKYPHKRKTKAIGRNNSMSVYKTWQDSIEDYAIWQKEFYKGGDYYQFLNGRYATDKKYINKLKNL